MRAAFGLLRLRDPGIERNHLVSRILGFFLISDRMHLVPNQPHSSSWPHYCRSLNTISATIWSGYYFTVEPAVSYHPLPFSQVSISGERALLLSIFWLTVCRPESVDLMRELELYRSPFFRLRLEPELGNF